MQKLGKTQAVVYEYIKSYISENSFPPTVREIGAAVGLKSTSTVHMHLKSLAEKGYIRLNPSMQRSIAVVSQKHDESAVLRNVPLVGTVAAGQPILAFDNIESNLPLPTALLHGAGENEVFILNIKGESMIDIGMYEGDMILVHRGMNAENGDIIVARIRGEEATVKRIYREQSRIRLQPENSSMQPIYADYEDVEIAGKVIGLIRSY